MEYRSLASISYESPALYDTTYQKRFEGEATVHLPFSIKGNPAFCVLTLELNTLIAKVYKTDKVICKLIAELPGVAIKQFTKRCLVDEIVLTNSIEGVNSTRRDIHNVLDNLKDQDHTNRFKGLVQKYAMLGKPGSISLNTCSDIRKIYDDLVLDEVIHDDPQNMPDGEIFRKSSVSVYSSTEKELHRGLYPESAIIKAMEAGLSFIQDPQYDLLLKVPVFHYLVGYIHPFYDGNGRLNRFLSSCLLANELEPLLGYRISYTIKENIKSYYNCFKICNDPKNRGDLTPFVLMFLRILALSEQQLLSAIWKRKKQLDNFMTEIGRFDFIGDTETPMGRLYCLLTQAALFSEKGISTQELLHVLEISRTTLSKRLEQFRSHGLLISIKEGREALYSLNLDAFGSGPSSLDPSQS